MAKLRCNKCLNNVDTYISVESDKKTGKQWAVERCKQCEFSGWPDNPTPYNEYLRGRRNREKQADARRDIRDIDTKGWGHFGL